jgi:hypothetical protein
VAETKSVKVSGSAKATVDHDEIREWVESHGGHPAMVKRTARNGKGGILRIDFPGYSGEKSLEEVSWDDFFEKFEESQLAFLYQDQGKSGPPSRFNKLVARESVAASSGRGRSSKRAASPGKKAARRSSSATGSRTTKKSSAQRTARAPQPARAAKRTNSKTARGAGSGTAAVRARTTKKKATASKATRRTRTANDTE